MEHPNFEWFETQHLKFLHKTLTEDWWRIQGGAGLESLELWLQIFKVLEDMASRLQNPGHFNHVGFTAEFTGVNPKKVLATKADIILHEDCLDSRLA